MSGNATTRSSGLGGLWAAILKCVGESDGGTVSTELDFAYAVARLPFRAAWTKRSPQCSVRHRRVPGSNFHPASRAVVVPWVSRIGRAFDAGDSAKIFVDGSQVTIRQVFNSRPGHCLEKISAERSRNAAGVNDIWWTLRMEVIQVHARPHDLNKL